MSKFTVNSKIKPAEDVFIKELPDSAVALNLDNENYYGLDSNSFYMYETIINSETVGHALETLKAEFQEQADQIESDLFEFIDQLISEGIVIVSE